MPGRRLWLVRHGETTGDSSVRYYGATDVPLSDLGREQVRALAPLLREQRFAALVHSPLVRAVESARIVRDALAAPPAVVEPEELLREVDFGTLEGRTAAEIAADLPDFYAAWRAGRVDRYPDGESIAGFRGRVAAGIDAVLGRHPHGDLCVVAHRGVVKSALVHLLGIEWETLRRWSLDLGSATILVAGSGVVAGSDVVADSDGPWVLDRYNVVCV